MTYSASLTWLCEHVAELRLHEGPDGRYGDPYVWTVNITRRHGDPAVAALSATLTAPPHGARPALQAALRAAGFTRSLYERRQGDVKRRICRPL